MAIKLKSFDFDTPSNLTTASKATYPWDEWFDGDIWQITEGEDFNTHPLMMERIIRTRATGKKARVRLRHVAQNGDPWGVIVMQRTDVTGPTAAKREARKTKAAATRAANAEAKNGSKAAAPVKRAPVKKLVPAKRISKRAPAAIK